MFIYGSGSVAERMAAAFASVDFSEEVVFLEGLTERATNPKIAVNVDDIALRGERVYIGVHNPEVSGDLIARRILEIGGEPVSFQNSVRELSRAGVYFENYMVSGDPAVLLTLENRKAEYRSFFRDSASRLFFDQFLGILELERMAGDANYLLDPDFYDSKSIPNWSPLPDVGAFVDLGAWSGDTLSSLPGLPEMYIGFEPQPEPFSSLVETASALGVAGSVWPLAAGAGGKFVRLAGSGTSAFVSDELNGDGIEVQMVALDQVLFGQPIGLLKMDIEGGEISALQGAERILSEQHPDLMLSVYHKPLDLFHILDFINEVAPGIYNFFLRSHAWEGFETLLYAQRKERHWSPSSIRPSDIVAA